MSLKSVSVYFYFWVISLIIIVTGIFRNNDLYLNIHDTYYVIENWDSTILLSSVYFIFGFGYWLFERVLKKPLNKTLTTFHSVILIGGFIAYWIVFLYSKMFLETPFPLFDPLLIINNTILILLSLVILVALPIYIVNLLFGIFRKSNSAIR